MNKELHSLRMRRIHHSRHFSLPRLYYFSPSAVAFHHIFSFQDATFALHSTGCWIMLAMHHKSTPLGSGQDNSQGKLPRRLDPVPDASWLAMWDMK